MAKKDFTYQKQLLTTVNRRLGKNAGDVDYEPVYEIMLFEHPNKERNGSPYLGATATVGYYKYLSMAVKAMHENIEDIRDNVYDAGFILCRFPGVHQKVTEEFRIYYVWNDDKNGFYEKGEPKIFNKIVF